jgi:hypothetical protein
VPFGLNGKAAYLNHIVVTCCYFASKAYSHQHHTNSIHLPNPATPVLSEQNQMSMSSAIFCTTPIFAFASRALERVPISHLFKPFETVSPKFCHTLLLSCLQILSSGHRPSGLTHSQPCAWAFHINPRSSSLTYALTILRHMWLNWYPTILVQATDPNRHDHVAKAFIYS